MFNNLGEIVFYLVQLAADLATVITLLFVVLPFIKAIKTQQATSIKNAYENQSTQRWTVINNPRALEITAKEYGILPDKFIKDTIASDRINAVAWQYEFYTQKLTEPELWEHQLLDIKGLFTIPLVAERWQKIKGQYDKDFQRFVDQEILTYSETSKTKSHEINSSSRHR